MNVEFSVDLVDVTPPGAQFAEYRPGRRHARAVVRIPLPVRLTTWWARRITARRAG